MSSLILNPSNSGSGSVTLNIFGDDTEYNINLPKTNGTLVSSVNGKIANNNGSVTIDVGVKSVNGVAPDSKGNVAVQVQSVATSDEVVAGTDNTKMMTPLRTKESVQQFSPTDYVTGLSVSGQTVTFTKKNGTTGKITTQDTKYTHPNSGVSAGTYNTVTVNAQGHVIGGSNTQLGLGENDIKRIVLSTFFPVGSTYISTDTNFNPNTQFGGSWSKIENRFLLGSGSRGVGARGGEENVTLKVNQMPSHSHSRGTVNINGEFTFHPDLTEKINGAFSYNRYDQSYSTYGEPGGGRTIALNGANGFEGSTGLQGSNASHNNMPPYEVVNIWKRIS